MPVSLFLIELPIKTKSLITLWFRSDFGSCCFGVLKCCGDGANWLSSADDWAPIVAPFRKHFGLLWICPGRVKRRPNWLDAKYPESKNTVKLKLKCLNYLTNRRVETDGSPEVNFRLSIATGVVQSVSGCYSPRHCGRLQFCGLNESVGRFAVPRPSRQKLTCIIW